MDGKCVLRSSFNHNHFCLGCRSRSICMASAKAAGRRRCCGCSRSRCSSECGGPAEESNGFGRHSRAEGDRCGHCTKCVHISCFDTLGELARSSGILVKFAVLPLQTRHASKPRHCCPGTTAQEQRPLSRRNSSRRWHSYCRTQARCEWNQDWPRFS